MKKKELVDAVFFQLYKVYADVKCQLDYKTEFQLLIATVLSAQTTDKMVNKVTPELFLKYPTSKELALANIEDVESIIKRIGLYKNKAKNIINASMIINNEFNGTIPNTMNELISIPGVGRKTANVFLGHIYGIGFAVDTHVKRLCNRIGVVTTKDPYKIEIAIRKLLDEKRLNSFSMLLIMHGRSICLSRNPKCEECTISNMCKIYSRNFKLM